ncbi:DUF2383 domain-containing protein [Defluviitalea phaphyphila]|uniref:DUF2383 domain-containing protein n=1 Tax=Defluviitalea phaphyphila TaxID=1473580 RepID=UPI00072FAAB1|nr:DUF2383 domain-containing protein [Defluviitalea phaphyphila]
MNEDTIKLLRECNAGCKSATNSMEQVISHIKDKGLKSLINKYNDKHIKIGDKCHEMLNECGEEEKDPKSMVNTFSWLTTEMKLMLKNDDDKIAELMIDGCNMGIKSVSRYLNQYKNASKESIELAHRLVKIEQEFMNDLLIYL